MVCCCACGGAHLFFCGILFLRQSWPQLVPELSVGTHHFLIARMRPSANIFQRPAALRGAVTELRKLIAPDSVSVRSGRWIVPVAAFEKCEIEAAPVMAGVRKAGEACGYVLKVKVCDCRRQQKPCGRASSPAPTAAEASGSVCSSSSSSTGSGELESQRDGDGLRAVRCWT